MSRCRAFSFLLYKYVAKRTLPRKYILLKARSRGHHLATVLQVAYVLLPARSSESVPWMNDDMICGSGEGSAQ